MEKKRKRKEKVESDRKAAMLSSDPSAALAGSIAHDFSNLLMIIRNAGEFLGEDLPPDDPSQGHVKHLLQAADRATRLVRQLQAFGRAQLLKPELLRPDQVIRSMSDTLRHVVPADVEFRVTVRSGEATVSFDLSQLQVVVFNLVTVAAELLRTRGRLQLGARVEDLSNREIAGVPVSGPHLSITVSASGAMLDRSAVSKAFEPRLTGRHLPRGTDLRLASAYGVVTQSGGYMESTTEDGTTVFRVFLPVVSDAESAASPKRLAVHRELTGTEVVFVVEDDTAVRSTVREALERYGYTVYEASDGAEALRLSELFNAPPDLVLTDLVMPGLTGRELISGLRSEGRLPKVLLMSGYTDDDVLRRARPTELYPFIKKPFSHQELARKVREVLDD